jgi:hypothetical protein
MTPALLYVRTRTNQPGGNMDEYVYIVVEHDYDFGDIVMGVYNNEASAVKHEAHLSSGHYYPAQVQDHYEEN